MASAGGKAAPSHLKARNRFLVINHEDSNGKDEDIDVDSSTQSSLTKTTAASVRTPSTLVASRQIGHKRNFLRDARDVYSAYQPNEVLGAQNDGHVPAVIRKTRAYFLCRAKYIPGEPVQRNQECCSAISRSSGGNEFIRFEEPRSQLQPDQIDCKCYGARYQESFTPFCNLFQHS